MSQQVVFIHGMWSRPWVWEQWIERFQQAGYQCTAVTLPGHGVDDPDAALEGLGLEDYVRAVTACVAKLNRPILVGHSLGALISQLVAARTPVKAAVLINSAAPAPVFPLRPVMLPGMVRHFMRWGLWRKSFRLSRWEADYLLLNRLEPAQRADYADRLTAESGRVAYQIAFGPLNWIGSNRVALDNIRCPLLALSGVQDRIVPIGVSRSMAQFYGSRLEYWEYPEHAHWMMAEPGYQKRISEVLTWLELKLEQEAGADHAPPRESSGKEPGYQRHAQQ